MTPGTISTLIAAITGFISAIWALYQGSHGVLQRDLEQVEKDRDSYHNQLIQTQDKYDKLRTKYEELSENYENLLQKVNNHGTNLH